MHCLKRYTTMAESWSQRYVGPVITQSMAERMSKISPAPSSPTIEDLQSVMRMYQSQQFLKYFEFDFDGPKSNPPKAFNDHIHRTSVLLSYVDGDISSFEKDVKARVTECIIFL